MGARTYWSAPVPALGSTDGPSVTAAALTDASPTASPIILPADILEVGTTLRMHAFGTLNCTSATPTVVLGFYYGGTAGVALAVSAALAMSASETLWPWRLDYEGEIRAIGSSGSIVGNGQSFNPTSLTAWTNAPIPQTAGAKTVTIDTTARKQLSVGCTFSVTTGTPTLVCQHFRAELMG